MELTKLEVQYLVEAFKTALSEIDMWGGDPESMDMILEALDILKSRDGINGETDSSNT